MGPSSCGWWSLLPILLTVFKDRTSRDSQVIKSLHFGGLLFANCSSAVVQFALMRFRAECEVATMRMSISKSKTMVLNQKRVDHEIARRIQ